MPHSKSFCLWLVAHSRPPGDPAVGEEEPGGADRRAQHWGRRAWRTHRKHCSRIPWANRPAWYSSPSITEGTVSVSSTMTAISLSRFPSMLRSLMLAEPIRRNSDMQQSCHGGRHRRPPSSLANTPSLCSGYQETLCFREAAGTSLPQGRVSISLSQRGNLHYFCQQVA